MSVFSKPLNLAIGATAFIGWAIWYDRRRLSHPDYKKNLVQKRKNQLIDERRKADPTYYVNEIPLCENPRDQMKVQTYTMSMIQKGEELLEAGDHQQGAAYIACGLGYMPDQMYRATLQQLAQGLPGPTVGLIQECGSVARPRAKRQQMEILTGGASRAAAAGGDTREVGKADIKEIEDGDDGKSDKDEEELDDGPQDVDSIDGDTEEILEEETNEPKIAELEEDDIDEEESQKETTTEEQKAAEVLPKATEEPEILSASQQSSVEIVKPEDIELIKEEMKQFSEDKKEEKAENIIPDVEKVEEVENVVPEVEKSENIESEKVESEKPESEKAESDQEEIFYASSNITPDPITPEEEKVDEKVEDKTVTSTFLTEEAETEKAESEKEESEKEESEKAESEKAESETAESVTEETPQTIAPETFIQESSEKVQISNSGEDQTE